MQQDKCGFDVNDNENNGDSDSDSDSYITVALGASASADTKVTSQQLSTKLCYQQCSLVKSLFFLFNGRQYNKRGVSDSDSSSDSSSDSGNTCSKHDYGTFGTKS